MARNGWPIICRHTSRTYLLVLASVCVRKCFLPLPCLPLIKEEDGEEDTKDGANEGREGDGEAEEDKEREKEKEKIEVREEKKEMKEPANKDGDNTRVEPLTSVDETSRRSSLEARLTAAGPVRAHALCGPCLFPCAHVPTACCRGQSFQCMYLHVGSYACMIFLHVPLWACPLFLVLLSQSCMCVRVCIRDRVRVCLCVVHHM